MWKRRVAFLFFAATLAAGAARGQRLGLPPGPMQEKARDACLGCHDARIMVQQRLDRKSWAKNFDKMIRWGAPVAAEDKEALINYFATHFAPAEKPANAPLADAAGVEKVRAACLSCHDAAAFTSLKLDRRGWTSVIDRQIRWGAKVRAEDREAILNYLATNYGTSPAPAAPKKSPGR